MNNSDNHILLAAIIRSIRDTCLRHMTFKHRVTTSGFLCVNVDGLQQNQFVIDEIFRKPGQEDNNRSYCIWSQNLKHPKSSHTARASRRESSTPRKPPSRTTSDKAPSLIPVSGNSKASDRRHKPHNAVRPQSHQSTAPTDHVTQRDSMSQRFQSPRPHSELAATQGSYRSTPRNAIGDRTPIMTRKSPNTTIMTRKSPNPAKRSPWSRVGARSSLSEMSRGTASSMSLGSQCRTRQFFRSTSRSERNNRTFTVEGCNSSSCVTGQMNNPHREPSPSGDLGDVHKAYPWKDVQNSATSVDEERIIGQGVFETQSSGSSVEMTSRDRSKGSTVTLSNSGHRDPEETYSKLSCLSTTDISCGFDMGQMEDYQENHNESDFMFEQYVPISATEPPEGFLENNIDPFQYFLDNYQNVDEDVNQSTNMFSDAHDSYCEESPMVSEPVYPQQRKATIREVYSDGDVLDRQDKARKRANYHNTFETNGNFTNASEHENEVYSQESRHCSKSQEISQLFDDVLSMLSQSHHRDFGNEAMASNWPSKSPRRGQPHNERVTNQLSSRCQANGHVCSSLPYNSNQLSRKDKDEMSRKLWSCTTRDRKDGAKSENTAIVMGNYKNANETNEAQVCPISHIENDCPRTSCSGNQREQLNQRTTDVRQRSSHYTHQGPISVQDPSRRLESTGCQVSDGGQRYTGSQESTGSWSMEPHVTASPSVIKKQSKLRKWLKLFKRDNSLLPVRPVARDAHTTVARGAHTTVAMDAHTTVARDAHITVARDAHTTVARDAHTTVARNSYTAQSVVMATESATSSK